MAKRKPKPDQHTSGFLVRLPERYRPALHALKRKTERPIAVEVRRAVDAYLAANGVEVPKEPA